MKISKQADEGQLTEKIDQYLTFILGNELYGFEVGNIREVIEYSQITSITHVPRVPEYIRGVINLRGEVMPVIDLACRLFRNKNNITRRTCIVIVEITDEDDVIHMGAMIDAVNSVVNISSGDIEPPMGFSSNMRPDFIHGIGRAGVNFVILLNMRTVLDVGEISDFKDYNGDAARLFSKTGAAL